MTVSRVSKTFRSLFTTDVRYWRFLQLSIILPSCLSGLIFVRSNRLWLFPSPLHLLVSIRIDRDKGRSSMSYDEEGLWFRNTLSDPRKIYLPPVRGLGCQGNNHCISIPCDCCLHCEGSGSFHSFWRVECVYLSVFTDKTLVNKSHQ